MELIGWAALLRRPKIRAERQLCPAEIEIDDLD
jgi:hypothetical protein